MHQIKSISYQSIPRALEKVERYRLLNEPAEAESICRDILAVENDNQDALVMLMLALSDQFNTGRGESEARETVSKISDDYRRAYYTGILKERLAKAAIGRGGFSSNSDAYEWLEEAMECFEKAASLRASDNDDSILRFNACVRTIQRHHLSPRQKDSQEPLLE